MIPGLSLVGAGTDSCWIDSRQLVTMQNYKTIDMKNNCLVKGFYIRSSNNFDYGYGIYTEGQSGLITANKFSNANVGIVLEGSNVNAIKNSCFDIRVGISVFNSNSIVRKNSIYTLTESIGDGIFIQAFNNNYHPIIDSNYIETRSEGIRKSINSRPIIRNNTIVLKSLSGVGMWLSSSDSAKVYNNLVIAEQGWQGILNNGTQYLLINDNYVTGYLYHQQNIDYAISLSSYNQAKNNTVTKVRHGVNTVGTQNLIYQYNNVWDSEMPYTGFIPDTTNLSVDPMIVNDDSTQGELDFHLQMFSPLIDAGDPNILDKDGTRSDIGLYGGPYGESYFYVDLPPRPPVNLTANVDTLIKLNWNKNTEADFSFYKVYRDTTFDFTVDSTKLIASVTDTFYYHTFPSNIETLYYKLTAVDNQGNESNPSEQVAVILVSVKDEWVPVNNYILYQNFPNPFNPSTKIGYKLKERAYVKLYVYDIKGELVAVLVNQTQEAGYYEIEFNAGVSHSGEVRNLSSGVYIYQIFLNNDNRIPIFTDVKKMIYVK
jgi:hypothetical protein